VHPATKGGVGAANNRDRYLEDQFRQFRQVSSEFVQGLAHHADFSTDADGQAAPHVNLALVRSVFGKWSLDVLVLFYSHRQLGFGEIKKCLPGISSRVLSSKLKTLEASGLVQREVLPTRPPRVNYALTERGLTVTKLGEPVLLFLRVSHGLYVDRERSARPASARGTDRNGRR